MKDFEREFRELAQKHGYDPYLVHLRPGLDMVGYEVVAITAYLRKPVASTEPAEAVD